MGTSLPTPICQVYVNLLEGISPIYGKIGGCWILCGKRKDDHIADWNQSLGRSGAKRVQLGSNKVMVVSNGDINIGYDTNGI